MSSEFGQKLRVQIFGASHGPAIGCVIDGLPAGEKIDQEELYAFLSRRRPGGTDLGTARNEADRPRFISGLREGLTSGSPLCAIIENTDQRSRDYDKFARTPRPGHADYTARLRYGPETDMRGGGHFSGRLTAPLCIAGGIAKQLLSRRGIAVGAHLMSVGDIEDEPFPLLPTAELLEAAARKPLAVLDDRAGEKMAELIRTVRQEGDSIGGTVECAAVGVPAGLGSPMFDGIENRLARVLFGIPAVKGVEFGSGFAGSRRRGSENNDPFRMEGDRIVTETNNCGGILGGISDGMPIVFRCAVKPTPSIAREQKTVDLAGRENAALTIEGRHDPCIAVRAVPVMEAACAAALLDLILEEKNGAI